jgi:hypothetical protein
VLGIPLDWSALPPSGDVGQAFGEAVEPMDLERGIVLHEGDGTTAAFRPRELEHLAQARCYPDIQACAKKNLESGAE